MDFITYRFDVSCMDQNAPDSTTIEIGDEEHTITQEDVIQAFEKTEEPSGRISHLVIVDGEKKGSKDVFRNIEKTPDSTRQFHTRIADESFKKLGFEVEVDEDPDLPIPHNTLNEKARYALTNYSEAKSDKDWNHPTVSVITSTIPNELTRIIEEGGNDYEISSDHLDIRGSAGAGRMANIPWIGVFDNRVAESPQDGLYIVYLFDTVENRLFLTLNQGMTELKDQYDPSKTKNILSKRAEILREYLDLNDFELDSIELPDQLLTGRNQYYGDSTVCYQSYDANNFPSEDEFIHGLLELTETYQAIIADDVYDVILESFDAENGVQPHPDSRTTSSSDPGEKTDSPTVWIEKTQIADRDYKQEGELQLGNAIMAPSRDQGGRKRYEELREADVGDIVLHLLQEQHQFVGVSVIDSELIDDFSGPPDNRWTEEQQEQGGYLRWLAHL